MKFTHLSRVYLGDVEFFELLSPKNLAATNLLKLARSRGLVFSLRAPNEIVRGKLALLPSDWQTVSRILEDMARPDPAERKTSLHVQNCAPNVDVFALVAHVRNERGLSSDETYNVTKISNDTTRTEVTYTEVDYSKAVPYQRRERKLYVDVTTSGETTSFRFSANDRAKQIVQLMQSQLRLKDDAPAKVAAISLFAVRDAALRTKFFTDLIKDIKGFKYQNTTHVNVDLRFPAAEDEESDEESVEDKRKKSKVAEKVKGLVNKMSLTGEQVLAAELYQLALESGYYICNISWSCESKEDSRFHIDCEAGFSDPVKADQFTFDVTRYWRFKPEAPDSEESVKMSDEQRRHFAGLLEEAAFRSYDAITIGVTKPVVKSKSKK